MERNGAARADVVAAALREHARELRAFVRARVPADEADDVLQVAAVRAIERADSLSDAERVRPWLYRLHRNVIVDVARSRARRQRLHEQAAFEGSADTEVAPSPGDDAPCRCSVNLAQQMNPIHATMLALVDAGDATVAEAARLLGITANNAAVRLHRARAALKETMQQHCGVSSVEDCDDCRCVHDGCCPV